MLAFFMATCPSDPDGAWCFREAVKGYQLKVIADSCEVPPSLVTKWMREGNVPGSRIDKLPDDAKRIYGELRAERWGALVVRRAALDWFFAVIGWQPAALASIGPAECGPLSRRSETRVA